MTLEKCGDECRLPLCPTLSSGSEPMLVLGFRNWETTGWRPHGTRMDKFLSRAGGGAALFFSPLCRSRFSDLEHWTFCRRGSSQWDTGSAAHRAQRLISHIYAGPKSTLQLKLILNLWSSCLPVPRAGIIHVDHQALFVWVMDWTQGIMYTKPAFFHLNNILS